MDLSSSDEEEWKPEFWNNWSPNASHKPNVNEYKSSRNRVPLSRDTSSDFARAAAALLSFEDARFGNWIPPVNFLKVYVNDVQNPKTSQKQVVKRKESMHPSEDHEVIKDNQEPCRKVAESSRKYSACTTTSKKGVNPDWGERIQLHDVTKFNVGDTLWGVVNLGIFSSIQLWVNEYGFICCSASGKISRIGSSESTHISINNSEILRKMLTVSSDQWASLCETVKETKTDLRFNAFEDCDLQKRSPLQKLWFFICKRRHLLPRQYMLLKYCGAIKCMRKLEITPKLMVQDIRYIE